jgi:2-isopropylmalate synthase
VLDAAATAVRRARAHTDDVQLGLEDATRADRGFLHEVVREGIRAGATTVTIADTVGYTVPDEMGELITGLGAGEGRAGVTLAVHCHDDLGLAVANSLAALVAGAGQVECAVNGIGERAGNASLEEVVMLLRTRRQVLGLDTGIRSPELTASSRLLSELTGIGVAPNKAVVGANAFAHEAGIHQHGVLANPLTYEILTPESVGADGRSLVLGPRSGWHGIRQALADRGIVVTEAESRQLAARLRAGELDVGHGLDLDLGLKG